MDKRISDKINSLRNEQLEKDAEKERKEKEEAARQEKYIQEQIPEARKWVEKYLFDAVAKATMKGEHELYLSSYSIGKDMPTIKSVVIAVEEVEGLKIRKSWHESYQDPNSESPSCRIDAGWSYYVVWD